MNEVKETIDAAGDAADKIKKLSPIQAVAWAATMLFCSLIAIGTLLFLDGRKEREKDRQQMNQLIEEIVILNDQNGDLIRNQFQVEMVKVCVKNNYDLAEEQWRTTKEIIGKTLQANGIGFPQELNVALMKYDVKRGKVKDCLIFPGKE